MYLPYCLAVMSCLLLRPAPPPFFPAKLLYRAFYLHYTPPPPRGPVCRYCSSCTCTHAASVEELYLCIKREDNTLRTGTSWLFSLILDGFLRPSNLSARLPAKNGDMYVANNSSILQYCHGMSIEGVLVFYLHNRALLISVREFVGGGGLTARRKCKSSLLCPPPSFSWK